MFMSRYPYLKLKLENVSKEQEFSINLIHYTELVDFEFDNPIYWIERGVFKLGDRRSSRQYKFHN